MKPSTAGISRFREHWLQVYGEELGQEDAQQFAQDLLEIGEIIYRHRLQKKNPISSSPSPVQS